MPDSAELRDETAGVFAVCDVDESVEPHRYAVWHVGTAPGDTVPRLRGAWVVESAAELEPLVRKRNVWALSEAAGDVVNTWAGALLDAEGTDAAVRDAVAALDAAFTAEIERSGRKLKRPDWGITASLGAAEPAAEQGADPAAAADQNDALVRRVLAAARRLEQLARQWSSAQSLRTARPFLRAAELGGESAAALPRATR